MTAVGSLKDHQIAILTNSVRDDLKERLQYIHFPDSLRGIISKSIVESLSAMDARADHKLINKHPTKKDKKG